MARSARQAARARGYVASLGGITPPTITLSALSLSTALTSGTAVSGTILGATAGSTIAASAGLTVNSANRTYAFDGTAAAGTITLTETLAGATNSPRTSGVTIAAAAVGTPTIAFANPAASVPEGDSGTKTVANTINVTRNGVTGALVVNLATGGTATSGSDYVALPATVTIPDGANSVSFDLTVNGDTAVEADETIVITATLAAYGTATATKTITILNDDANPGAPNLTVTPGAGQNTLSWTDGAAGSSPITGHKLYRSATDNFTPGPGNLVGTITSASPYVDGSLTNGTAYFYRLSAVNGSGEGAFSAQVAGTPVAAGPTPTFLPTLSAAPLLVYSPYKLVANFAQTPAYITRASDGTSMNIPVGADGQSPDMSGVAAFLSGTTGVWHLRDQSGNGRDDVATNPPSVVTNSLVYGKQGLSFINTAQSITLPTTFSVDRANMTYASVGGYNGGGNQLAEFGSSATTTTNYYVIVDNYRASALGTSFQRSNYPLPADIGLVITNHGATHTLRVNNRRGSLTTFAASAMTAGKIGTGYKSAAFSEHYADVVYPSLSAADETALANALNTVFAIPGFNDQIVMMGDSIQFGQGSATGRSVARRMSPNLSRRVFLSNIGISGQTSATIANSISYGNVTAFADAAAFPGKQIAFDNSGTNDINNYTAAQLADGTALSDMQSKKQSIITALKNAGFRYVFETILPRNFAAPTADRETLRTTFNQWMRDNATPLGITICETAGAVTLADLSDGTHPGDAGYDKLEVVKRNTANALLAA